jgi:hypothetical protein
MKNKLFYLYISLCILVILSTSFGLIGFVLFVSELLLILGLVLCICTFFVFLLYQVLIFHTI